MQAEAAGRIAQLDADDVARLALGPVDQIDHGQPLASALDGETIVHGTAHLADVRAERGGRLGLDAQAARKDGCGKNEPPNRHRPRTSNRYLSSATRPFQQRVGVRKAYAGGVRIVGPRFNARRGRSMWRGRPRDHNEWTARPRGGLPPPIAATLLTDVTPGKIDLFLSGKEKALSARRV